MYESSGTHSDEKSFICLFDVSQEVCNFVTGGGESVLRDLSTTSTTIVPIYKANA
jgi:hypothetical protein